MKQRIFISSVQKEFAEERQALKAYLLGDALLSRFFDVFLFEDLPASDRRADAAYLDEVRRCDLYLALLGNEYGWKDADGLSQTHREFNEATKLGKPRIVFVKGANDEDKHPKMRALMAVAGAQLIRRRFTTVAELIPSVYASLADYLEAKELGLEAVDVLFDPQRHPDSDRDATLTNPAAAAELVRVSSYVNELLMKELERDPNRMLSLTPRQFEEFVAQLFEREGFDVELTPPVRDGGRDIIAVQHSHLGTHRYLAECKRYDRGNPVGVERVRSLYGVVEKERTTYAVLATTSSFTAGAKEFANEVQWRLGLKDYHDLREWLKRLQ